MVDHMYNTMYIVDCWAETLTEDDISAALEVVWRKYVRIEENIGQYLCVSNTPGNE